MKDQEKLESLLAKGIITQEEFDHLQRQRNEEESDSVVTKILFFILTVIAIGLILCGTCIMNIAIVYGMSLGECLTILLMIVWLLFPLVLFGWIAHKTKNAGMKWAVIIWAIGALLFVAVM